MRGIETMSAMFPVNHRRDLQSMLVVQLDDLGGRHLSQRSGQRFSAYARYFFARSMITGRV